MFPYNNDDGDRNCIFCCHEFLRKKLFQLFNASVVFWHNWISTQNNMTKCILESLFNSSLLRFLGCSVVFHKVFAIKVFYSIFSIFFEKVSSNYHFMSIVYSQNKYCFLTHKQELLLHYKICRFSMNLSLTWSVLHTF